MKAKQRQAQSLAGAHRDDYSLDKMHGFDVRTFLLPPEERDNNDILIVGEDTLIIYI